MKNPTHTKLLILGVILVATIAMSALVIPAKAAPGAPTPPSTGAYTTGVYRNLFREAGYSDADIQNKINTAWNQLFYGTAQQKIYYTVGTDMAYIKDIADNDVRTEGQSYGMMIAVQLNKKAEFDKIWKWTKTYMQWQTGPRAGYIAWHADTSGTKLANNNASDGEVWMVTALFMAAGRWGNGSGIYNYQAEAQAILDAGRSKEATSASTGVYDLFNPSNKLVRFVAEDTHETGTGPAMYLWTDPSYMEPAFYDYWAKVANKDNAFWSGAATAARSFLQSTANTSTGLVPDYANFDGSAHYCCPDGAGNHHYYGWDARRTQMNIAMDYNWWAADPWQKTQSDRLQNFFYTQGVTTFGAEYQLNGTMITNYHESGHVAMNAAAGLAGTTPKVWGFVDHLWTVPIPTGTYRYYDGLLYMLGFLQTSGNFKIYGGGAAAPAPTPTPGPTATAAPAGVQTHVGGMNMTIPVVGQQYQGKVTISILNEYGNPVSGATVSGTWSGATPSGQNGLSTDATGTVILYSAKTTSKGPYTFCVTSIMKSGMTYNSGANVASCASATAP